MNTFSRHDNERGKYIWTVKTWLLLIMTISGLHVPLAAGLPGAFIALWAGIHSGVPSNIHPCWKVGLAAGELTGCTWLPPRWACSGTGRSSLRRTDPPSRPHHTGSLNTRRTRVSVFKVRPPQPGDLTLTLAAEVVPLLQVVVAVFTGGAGSTAGVGLTVTLTRFLSDTTETLQCADGEHGHGTRDDSGHLLTCAHSATPLSVPAMLHSQSAGEKKTDSSSVYCLSPGKRVCVNVSHWSSHPECQQKGSSTEVYTCRRPRPPREDGTRTGPERTKINGFFCSYRCHER